MGSRRSIRYYYETEVNVFCWEPGSANPVYTGTKLNSLSIDQAVLPSANGRLHFDFDTKNIDPQISSTNSSMYAKRFGVPCRS